MPDSFAGHGNVGPRLPVHWRRHEKGSKLRVRVSVSGIRRERGSDSRRGFREHNWMIDLNTECAFYTGFVHYKRNKSKVNLGVQ